MKKCAYIRSDEGQKCPFGLPIPNGCKYAGKAIYRMKNLEDLEGEEKEKAEEANKRIFIYSRAGGQCPFADNIMNDFDAVNCDFGDNAAGMKSVSLTGSPYYPSVFVGITNDYQSPLAYYSDNSNITDMRQMFQSVYSLVGAVKAPEIIKNAIMNVNETIWNKIQNDDILLPDEQEELGKILKNIKNDGNICDTK